MKLAADKAGEYEFISILAHELRNPLAGVISTLELLELRSEDPGRKQEAALALREAKAISMMLDNFLDAARARERRFSLHKKRLRLGEIATLRLPLAGNGEARTPRAWP